MSAEPLLADDQMVVWVIEVTRLPTGSQRSALHATADGRRWIVHMEHGTATGIDYSAEREFVAAGPAAAWARDLAQGAMYLTGGWPR